MTRFCLLTLAMVWPVLAQSLDKAEESRRAREEYGRLLYHPQRDPWQMPEQVIRALAIKPGETIATVEDSAGYFARRFAREAGRVYLVSGDLATLQYASKEKPPNLETIRALPTDPKLGSRTVDTIFLCNALTIIRERPAYYALLARSLSPQGRIVVIDFFKQNPPPGIAAEGRITEDSITKEMAAAGFRKIQRFDFLPFQFFVVFAR
jgi:predicted methyltransferase